MGVSVLIPYLVGRTVDEIRDDGANLWPLALAVVAAGLLRLVFSVAAPARGRARCRSGVEYDLRNRMYEHLQSLELGLLRQQQTGQLMSRATVDLQAVRFFLGYGLIFLLQSAITIVIAAAVMVALDPGSRWSRSRRRPSSSGSPSATGGATGRPSQEVQQRIAELTAEAEENIGGVRVVKAFAQEPRQLRRFSTTVKRACSTSRWSPRGCAPSTRRSSASSPSSAWPRCCSSAAAR